MFEFVTSWLVIGSAACGSGQRAAAPHAHDAHDQHAGQGREEPHEHGQHPHGEHDPHRHDGPHANSATTPGHDGPHANGEPMKHGHDGPHANAEPMKHGHDGPHANGEPMKHGHSFTNAEEWAKRFDDPARDAWQKPDDVIRALQLTPTSVVADVGAGTGYFAVRLARAVPKGLVIATDLEPDMLRYLEERARREKLTNLRAVAATTTTSGLAANSVDVILVVDVWHHIDDRVAYARDLAAALRPGGRVVIVDFRLDASHGPPPAMRLAPEAIVADLRAAGFDAKLSAITLPDQYIVEARRRERAAR